MSDELIYAGIVEDKSPGDFRPNLRYVRPVLALSGDLSAVAREFNESNATEEFPNEGVVDWYSPSDSISVDSCWCFSVIVQPSYDNEKPHHHRYRVGEAIQPLSELLLDAEDLGEEGCRAFYTEAPLYLNYRPAQTVYIAIGADLWVGPVSLLQAGDPQNWSVDTNRPLTCVRAADASQILTVGSRCFLWPRAHLVRVGQVDWASDTELLKRALKYLRRRDSAFTDSLGLTIRAINHLTEVLGVGIEDSLTPLDDYRSRRARQAVDRIARHVDLIASIRDDVLAIPQVQLEIEQAKEQAAQDAVRHVTESIAEERARLKAIENQVHDKRARAAELGAEIAEKERKIRESVDSVESAIAARLVQVMKTPQELIAEVAILRAAFSPESGRGPTPSVPNESLAPDALPEGDVSRVTSNSDLRRKLRQHCRTARVSSAVGQPLHSAFAAGLLPAVAGFAAMDVLVAYANTVTAGNLLWIPVTPSLLSPTDLLMHNGGELLDLLREALISDRMYMVILEGANRGAADAYLAPIVRCYSARGSYTRDRLLPVGDHATADFGSPSGARRVAWPDNVLLGATLIDGTTSLALSSWFWRAAAYMEAEAIAQGYDTGALVSAPEPVGYVTAEDWRAWLRTRSDATKATDPDVTELLDYDPAHRADADAVRAFYAIAHDWAKGSAREQTIRSVLVPSLLREPRRVVDPDLARMVQSIGNAESNLGLENYMERLGRHVLGF